MSNLSFYKYFKNLAFLALIMIFLNSCGVNVFDRKDPIEPNARKRARQNVEEGKGFSGGGLFGGKGNTNFEFASSNPLWRATLDTLDFMPLLSADYGGGILITDWYNENNNYEDSIKISIRFLTNEIRSDALNVKVYTKTCENLNKCRINEDNPEVASKLVSTILKKASKYKQDEMNKKKKRRSSGTSWKKR